MQILKLFFDLSEPKIESNSSHIFLLNQRLENCIDDFVEGYNVWEKTKAEIIVKMAETLEKLYLMGEYTNPLSTISGYIAKRLRERGVSQGQIDYVREVLPSKYKNPELAREQDRGGEIHANNDKPVNIYALKKELETMSKTELQDYALNLDQKHKHARNNMKAEKEVLEYVAIKTKTPLPRYRKDSSDVPPEHLHKETTLSQELDLYSKYFFELYKYFEDIKKSVVEFPPDAEISLRTTEKLRTFRDGVLKTLKMLIVPYTDKKWSGSWVKWCDIHLTRLEQSKNYAGSKHALNTGEFAVKYKDGKEHIFELDRGITREQVGDKEPEMFEMAKQMMLGIPMINALEDWSYNTFVDEEYDVDGNPVTGGTN